MRNRRLSTIETNYRRSISRSFVDKNLSRREEYIFIAIYFFRNYSRVKDNCERLLFRSFFVNFVNSTRIRRPTSLYNCHRAIDISRRIDIRDVSATRPLRFNALLVTRYVPSFKVRLNLNLWLVIIFYPSVEIPC